MQPSYRHRRSLQGFTLIEMMIVAAVIAILAAIAYPAYTEQMRKSQRAEGKAALMRASQLLERSFTQNGSYPAGAAVLATLYGAASGTSVYSHPDNPMSATLGKYRVEYLPAAGVAPVEFELRATPQSYAISDADCPTLGIDSRGRRLVSGAPVAADSRCWR
jgi:type IV pilus assembly protein PilE